MSYSYVHPGEQSLPGVTKRWLIAYPLAQLLCLGGAASAAAISSRVPGFDPLYMRLSADIAVAAIYGLTFGYLRGSVMRDKLARFSMLWWCAAIAGISVFFIPPEPEVLTGSGAAMSSLQSAARALLPVLSSGFIYGLAIGAAEALSLRRAAFGLFGWVVLSGIAWGLGHVAASALASFAVSAALSPFQSGTIQVICMTLQAVIAGLLMVPALRLLAPRLSYYGPRVYRSALRSR
ncbi:MAG: hypothetical protein AB7V13_10310 [Pseudorhodoplanes sp.]|uniref:hypothetical protein n=1 Tax=Pseudorhodoplanes sp. TaxID=1934341 RepID=UPI003D0D2CBC